MLRRIVVKVALWALGQAGHVRHIGKGNSIVLRDRFNREVCLRAPPVGNAAWEAGCTCESDKIATLDCPIHYLPHQKAVYVRLK